MINTICKILVMFINTIFKHSDGKKSLSSLLNLYIKKFKSHTISDYKDMLYNWRVILLTCGNFIVASRQERRGLLMKDNDLKL